MITEVNCWEREKWNYILDLEKQSGEALNWLFIFERLAREQFEKDKKNATSEVFASSNYWIKFYDRYEVGNDGYLKLINGDSTLIMNGDTNYKSAGLMLDKVIIPRKMKGAMQEMRDKKTNRLYKNFEYVLTK